MGLTLSSDQAIQSAQEREKTVMESKKRKKEDKKKEVRMELEAEAAADEKARKNDGKVPEAGMANEDVAGSANHGKDAKKAKTSQKETKDARELSEKKRGKMEASAKKVNDWMARNEKDVALKKEVNSNVCRVEKKAEEKEKDRVTGRKRKTEIDSTTTEIKRGKKEESDKKGILSFRSCKRAKKRPSESPIDDSPPAKVCVMENTAGTPKKNTKKKGEGKGFLTGTWAAMKSGFCGIFRKKKTKYSSSDAVSVYFCFVLYEVQLKNDFQYVFSSSPATTTATKSGDIHRQKHKPPTPPQKKLSMTHTKSKIGKTRSQKEDDTDHVVRPKKTKAKQEDASCDVGSARTMKTPTMEVLQMHSTNETSSGSEPAAGKMIQRDAVPLEGTMNRTQGATPP